MQRVKPTAFINAVGIYDKILCTFLNAKLLFSLFAYKIFLCIKKRYRNSIIDPSASRGFSRSTLVTLPKLRLRSG